MVRHNALLLQSSSEFKPFISVLLSILCVQTSSYKVKHTHSHTRNQKGRFNVKSSSSSEFYLADAVGSARSNGRLSQTASYIPTILCSQHLSALPPQRRRLCDSWQHAGNRSYSDGSFMFFFPRSCCALRL